MDYTIEDIDLSNQIKLLSLKLPDNLAFIPENFESAKTKDEFIYTDSMVDLSKIFLQEQNISFDIIGQDTELYRSRKNNDIYLPAIFFSLSLLTSNSTIIAISMNVLSSYIYDLCKGSSGKRTTHIDLYIETKEKGTLKKICYSGSVEGLKELDNIIKDMRCKDS